MPGGFGTLDEFFGAITLIQTRKMEMFPIIIFDKEFYQKIVEHNQKMLEKGTISKSDEKLYIVTDSIPEAISYIKEKSIMAFGLKYMKPKKAWWAFWEKGFKRVF
jgi:predicted Rossmann-fold nucleotide-binding protein